MAETKQSRSMLPKLRLQCKLQLASLMASLAGAITCLTLAFTIEKTYNLKRNLLIGAALLLVTIAAIFTILYIRFEKEFTKYKEIEYIEDQKQKEQVKLNK